MAPTGRELEIPNLLFDNSIPSCFQVRIIKMEGPVKFSHEDGNRHCAEMWKNMHEHDLNLRINGRESDSRFRSSTLLFSMCSDLIYGAICDIMEQRELDLEDKMVVVLPDFSKNSISYLLRYVNEGSVEFCSQEEQDELSELLTTIGFRETARFVRQSEDSVIRPKRLKRKLLRKKNKLKKRKMTFDDVDDASEWVPDFSDDPSASTVDRQSLPIDVKLEVPDENDDEGSLLDDKAGILGEMLDEDGNEDVKQPIPAEKVKKRRRRKKVKPPPDELTECPHCHKMLKYKSLYYHTKSCTRAVKRECKRMVSIRIICINVL